MAETWLDQTVFLPLPLDDPLFLEHRVAYNSEDVIYATPLGEQFDALIQYGVAHRMPIDRGRERPGRRSMLDVSGRSRLRMGPR